ncbi:MAG: acyl--CoA ligase [Deltaproteobacteria bacterium]|nr:acyl--CoA ligase [Deltaproteobacteria bacterium]
MSRLPFPTAEEIVTSRARREPMRPALEWHHRGMLLGRLADLTAATADAIAAHVPAGACVAQLMSSTPGVVVMTLGTWRAGCIAVPLEPGLATGELARRIRHSGVHTLVAHEEHAATAEESIREAGRPVQLLVSRGPDLLPAGGPGRPRPIASRRAKPPRRSAARVHDVAFHAWVTGRDGVPRAAVLSHANVVASALRVSGGRGDGPDDVALATHPLYDVAGFVAEVLSRLISGGSAAILGPGNADGVLHSIENHRVTDLSLSSEHVALLLDVRRIPRRAIRSVRKVLLRNVRLPMTVKHELADRFPDAELIQSYGRPESTDGILMARQDELFRKADTLGKPHPGLVVGIVDDSGRLLRPGQRGEIVCRGAVVMRGYHRAPTPSRAALRDGWLHTGDLGYIDEDGAFGLVGTVPPAGPRRDATAGVKK